MKKITSLFILLVLIITSLSSCSISELSSILNPSFGQNNDGGETSGNENSPEASGDVSGGTESNGNISSDESEAEFYPTYGEAGITSPQKAMLSVVSILARFESEYGSAAGKVGSGVIYDIDKEKGDAYIITNFHVVYNRYSANENYLSSDISLNLYGMEQDQYNIKAKYIGGSMTQDLALLKVEGSEVIKNSYARAADIADSDAINVLDSVIVIGNPEGYGLSVTTGIVSVDSETLSMIGADNQTQLSLRVIRVDAAVNDGNSGGGLFDREGNLIGIVNAKRTGNDIDNIAYAIPISFAKNFAENIRCYCDGETVRTPSKCLLGVTVTNSVIGLIPDAENGTLTKTGIVEVESLTDNSVLLGKIQIGDRLTSVTVDGVTKSITRVHHLIDHMLLAKVGSTVTLEGTRNGTAFTVTITVPEAALTEVR